MLFLVLMLPVVLVLPQLPACRGLGFNDDNLRAELFSLQTVINSEKNIVKPEGDQMHPASSTYLTQHWRNYTGDKPIMVRMTDYTHETLPHCVTCCFFMLVLFALTNQYDNDIIFQIATMNYHFQRYGNFIGNYFDDISCAKVAGLHFVGVLARFDDDESKSIFWKALPTILPHSSPAASFDEAAKIVKQKCKCSRYCWSYEDPMMDNMPFIGSLVRQSVYAHLSQVDKYGIPRLVQPWEVVDGVDLYPHDLNQPLPMLPGKRFTPYLLDFWLK
jgi:hypothetical protein